MARTFRRVVTGHDAEGKAVAIMDGIAGNVRVRSGAGIASTLLWVTDETPADISGREDAADRQIGVPPPDGGSVFRIVEFPPERNGQDGLDAARIIEEMGLPPEPAGKRHPLMHRTRSIDYAVVLSGEITMLLDEEEISLQAGDVVVQRGTSHAWSNRGRAPCAVAFVLIDAKEPAG